jgi:uncharacterized protein YprB with RNaseH-like and TPR domain
MSEPAKRSEAVDVDADAEADADAGTAAPRFHDARRAEGTGPKSEWGRSRGTRSLFGPGPPPRALRQPSDRPGSTAARQNSPPESRHEEGVEAFLAGGELRDESGAVFVHERLRSDIERRRPHWGRLEPATPDFPELQLLEAIGLERALFLDLETGGLTSSPVFLAGTMHWNGEDFVLRQYFARHYGEEAALLRAVHEMAQEFDALITFNGKSYDAPFLVNRAALHGVRMRLPLVHVDLLHLSRRRWKSELRDCRLQTLEWHVCRRRRSGDVPGEEVPGLYHDYVKNGDPWRLVPVFHHNMLDVITMAEILQALGARCGRTARFRAEIA